MRRREIAVSIDAARCAIKGQVCENETPPSVASFGPLAARQGVSKELGPMFSPFSAPRRSFSTKKGRGVVFRGITATQARFWVD